MKAINPEHVAAVSAVVNQSPFFRLLSMHIKELAWGTSCLEIRVQEKHLQPYGIVHGGVHAALIDAAAFWATYTQVSPEQGLTTVEMKLNYLAPAAAGSLIARGRCIKVGQRLGLGEATIQDPEGRILAHGTATMMLIPSFQIQGQTKLPPKYL